MKLALLGNPVEHSLSPLIQNAALRAAGIEGTYEARSVDEAGIREAFVALRAGQLDGFNVTMPHKTLAASLCDHLDLEAQRADSVNTVVREAGRAIGYSTDVGAVRAAWNGLPGGTPVLILGAGGAAAATVVALVDRPLYVATRRPGQGSDLGKKLGVQMAEVRWNVPVVASVVVNCTPLGMRGESLPEVVLDLSDGLLDMAYGPLPTPAVAWMAQKGQPVVDGVELLLAQAGMSFSLWMGGPAPMADMRQAVENRLRR